MTLIKVFHQQQFVCTAIPFGIAFIRHRAHFLVVDKDFRPRSVAGILYLKVTEVWNQLHFFHIGTVRSGELHPPFRHIIVGCLNLIHIRTELLIPSLTSRSIRIGSLRGSLLALTFQSDHGT